MPSRQTFHNALRLNQFALLGNHPPVAVLLSQPCPASLFRSRWRHGAPAADLGLAPGATKEKSAS